MHEESRQQEMPHLIVMVEAVCGHRTIAKSAAASIRFALGYSRKGSLASECAGVSMQNAEPPPRPPRCLHGGEGASPKSHGCPADAHHCNHIAISDAETSDTSLGPWP